MNAFPWLVRSLDSAADVGPDSALETVPEEVAPEASAPDASQETPVEGDIEVEETDHVVLDTDVPDSAFDDLLSDPSDLLPDAGSEAPSPSDEEGSLEESGISDYEQGDPDPPDSAPLSPSQYLLTFDGESIPFTVTAVSDLDALPASVTASNAAYTPQVWQVNLAENRSFGEHYVMWAVRTSSGSSSYYWRYYIAIGRDITYASNVYTYHDAEVYSYYTYNSSVTYDVSVSSGTVNGSSYLVYSDLYFDYVGVDPAFKGSVYIFFTLFLIMIALLVIGGKRNV